MNSAYAYDYRLLSDSVDPIHIRIGNNAGLTKCKRKVVY